MGFRRGDDIMKTIDYNNVGRNDKCPCGSDKKYKKCCMNKMNEEFKKKVISLGELSINQCPDFYNNMDMIFFPSNLECFSATPLEALYMKKSIVCSNLPFNKNIIGNFGVYFEPNDPVSAAEKIASTLKKHNDEQLKEAKKFVFSNFKSEDRFKIYINTILKNE